MEHHKLNGNPTIFVMLGATGDLAEKKIIPALFNLYKKGKLPEKFKVIGFAKSKYTDEEFQKFAAGKLKGATKKQKNNFSSMFTYRQGLFEKKEDYKELIDAVTDIDDNWGVCSNKLFYLAVLPEFFEIIARNLSKTGLTAPCSPEEGWTRILVEKPFGKDAKTARRLDELLSTLFNENQIYRIDHYLAKEMLQNILAFRFSNNLLESSWNNRSVEKIDIRLWEKIGVENRGAFYDGVGALRDVGQNHLLQMLALVTMDHPQDFRSDSIRLKRAELMRTLTPPPPQDIKKFSYRAQHKGYREIEGVDNKSQTETYFKIRGFLSHPLWRNVPIYMESGKRLEKQLKEVVVTFKHPNPCMCPPEIEEHYRNQVKFTLEPEEGIKITFLTKEPGLDFEVSEGEFNFTMRKNNQGAQYVEEYEKLLLDCIEGDNTLFVSTDEVRAMWNFIDPFLEAWEQNKVPLKNYKPGTLEPVKAVDIAQNHIVKERIKKELGIVGLGKMGRNLAESLKE
ncbi:MAG: glucose-6-phosphate dehydrogenase [Candidatus Spechtbacterales bacterium]|nr:glucose-6-phosphate dehydrogenase [Candidatus Spechtbacterales bacterium]